MVKKTVLAILVSILFLSCSVKEPIIGNPAGLEVEELSMKSVKLKVMIPIENPNNFSFTIRNLNLDLIVSDRNVGKVKRLDKVKIPANSKDSYAVSFELTPKDALNNILFLVGELQKRKPKLEVKGTITVSKLGIPRRIKVEHEQNFERF
jgi:LEA14-like dessication related protein